MSESHLRTLQATLFFQNLFKSYSTPVCKRIWIKKNYAKLGINHHECNSITFRLKKQDMHVDSYKITDSSYKNAEEFLRHQNNNNNKSKKLILCFVVLH